MVLRLKLVAGAFDLPQDAALLLFLFSEKTAE
jgi:hypothetical protein